MKIIYDEERCMFKLQYVQDNLLHTVESFSTANAAMKYYQRIMNSRDDLK